MIEDLKQQFNKLGSKKLLSIFLLLLFILNLLQAYLTGLHADEAYYWVYSRFLAWGYFDHPPMVAIYIKAGYSLFQNTLGLRLVTVFSGIGSVYLLWLIIKQYVVNVQLFIIIFSSVLIFHVFGFITTPDAPLLFFSVLFLYVYQIYLKEDQLKWALLLGVVCASLLFSKYHGVLLLFFVSLSNLNLFRRKSFYFTILTAIVLFAPHIYWQYQNGYPSLYYHLFDRSARHYKFVYSAQYFLDQLLMMGPLSGWLLFYFGFRLKARKDDFLRGLQYVVYGFLIFFFFSTFKGRVQAQWPLIEFIALVILATIYAGKDSRLFEKYKWLFVVNMLFIFVARMVFMGAIPALNKIHFVADFRQYNTWAKQIDSAANGHQVIFKDGFQKPSLYNFYTHSLRGVGYNSFHYRKTQYDLWPLEDSIQHQNALLVSEVEKDDPNLNIIQTPKGRYAVSWLDDVRFYPKINFEALDFPAEWQPGQVRMLKFRLSNPYHKKVDFSDKKGGGKCSFLYGFFSYGEVKKISEIPAVLSDIQLTPHQSKVLNIKIKAPSETGDYKLFLSVKTAPFAGTRNSRMMKMKVK